MLREVGNKDIAQLKLFLDAHAAHMPRTMLRYAIEKLPQDERVVYLKKVPSIMNKMNIGVKRARKVFLSYSIKVTFIFLV
jgi:hypothetical protein